MFSKDESVATVLRLADGSLWMDPPNYLDGSGCSSMGNRRHATPNPTEGYPRHYYSASELRDLDDRAN
jgi:hypothetical protein